MKIMYAKKNRKPCRIIALKVYRFHSRKKPATHALTSMYMASSNKWHLHHPCPMEPKDSKVHRLQISASQCSQKRKSCINAIH